MPRVAFDIRTAMASAPAVVGVAALWMSLYKRLLYPVMFSFQRTGFEGGMTAQGIYALVFVTTLFALYVFHGKAARALIKHKWVAALFGIGGAAGLLLLAPTRLLGFDTAEAFNVGSVLVAIYMPVHLAFWAFYVYLSDTNRINRTLISSFALFLAVNLALIPVSGQSSVISIACPLISALMIAVCKPVTPAAFEIAAEKASANRYDATSVDDAALTASTTDAPSALSPSKSTGASLTVSANAIAPAASVVLAATAKPEPAHVSYEPFLSASPKSRSVRHTIRQFGKDFGLSDREAELTAYAYRNYSARKIAGELFIAESTVYTHLKRIYKKTNVHSKQELIDLIDEWKDQVSQDRGQADTFL